MAIPFAQEHAPVGASGYASFAPASTKRWTRFLAIATTCDAGSSRRCGGHGRGGTSFKTLTGLRWPLRPE